KVYLKKPGKMRWDYREPVKDEIVSNGKTVWVYQPDLNQVISRPADAAASGIATDFLSGIGDLEKDFDIRLAAQDTETWTLELTPRTPQPNLKKLLMDVDKKSMLAVKTRVFDHFGNETQVSFNDIKINNALTDLMFEFIPPEGASVIRP
ncbi:MAG: outer membrane lipoprotein carrier protein LolA, partial [Thermodesulfobacteriota bacterium]